MIFPFIEQVMVAEVGLIRIASEARFASFDQSIAGVWRELYQVSYKDTTIRRLVVPKMIRGILDVF